MTEKKKNKDDENRELLEKENIIVQANIKKQLLKTKKSKAKKVKMLLLKQKGVMGAYESLVDFKEPVLLLIRNNGKVEYFEDVTTGLFKINHSSGKDLYIYLESSQTLKFDYAKRSFRGFIHFEDEFLSYPHKPILYSESMNELMQKAINDTEFLELEHKRIPIELIAKVMGGIALIILVIAIGQWFTHGQLFSFLGSTVVEETTKQVGGITVTELGK